MAKIGQPYTAGNWTVKPGNEDAFVAAWTEFIEWSLKVAPDSGPFYLMQDTTNPRHFISVGEWDNPDAVLAWQRHPEFPEYLGKARSLCETLYAPPYKLVSAPTR